MSSAPSELRSTLVPGTVIAGKYRIDRILGEGGMGIVVKAHHLHFDEPVAIKFLLDDIAGDPTAGPRFLREAKAALRIKSPFVVRALDVDELPGGTPFMVLELLEGRDLDKRLEADGKLPIDESVDIIVEACSALTDAHAQGIIHRDLKPANLFETRDSRGRPSTKVLDFGISKFEGDISMTTTRAVMGSVPYMSPEQLMSSTNVDSRSDVYSIAVTLYELITGRRPFDADSLGQLVTKVLGGAHYAAAQVRPDVPAGLSAEIAKAMDLDPYARHSSAAELALAIMPYGTARAQAQAGHLGDAAPAATSVSGPVPAHTTPAFPSSRGSSRGSLPEVTQVMPGSTNLNASTNTRSASSPHGKVVFIALIAAAVALPGTYFLQDYLVRRSADVDGPAAGPEPDEGLETDSDADAEVESDTPEVDIREPVEADTDPSPEPSEAPSASASADAEAPPPPKPSPPPAWGAPPVTPPPPQSNTASGTDVDVFDGRK